MPRLDNFAVIALFGQQLRVLLARISMRRSVILLGLGVLITVAGALAWPDKSGGARPASTTIDGGVDMARLEVDSADAGDADHPAASTAEAAVPTPQEEESDREHALPSVLPKTVRFGVILIQYRGAQVASPVSRSRDEASALARSIAAAAKTDFKTQVGRGDPGSMEDAGTIPRGVLEPAVEYGLFRLGPGQVSDPIDTPRGFWIVRRIE
jgi:hypothetical protein